MNEEPYVQFKLRLPESMRDRLEIACAESGRSLSAEILYRLDATLPRSDMDLTLLKRRRELNESESRYDIRRRELADLERMLKFLNVSEDHPDRDFYKAQVVQARERLAEAIRLREVALHELQTAALPTMDQD